MKTSIIIGSCMVMALAMLSGVASADEWIIDGDKVYMNDSHVYLSAEPHTLHASGWVTFNMTSWTYTGATDFVWGFDTQTTHPKTAQLHHPHWHNWTTPHSVHVSNVTDIQTCAGCACDVGHEYNSIKRNVTVDMGSGNLSHTIYCFDSYTETSVGEYDLFWNTPHSEWVEWHDWTDKFSAPINHDHGGMNKWYPLQDVQITAGGSYSMRVWMDVPVDLDGPQHKYWWAAKPHSETINEAISAGHFYALDPWYNSSWTHRQEVVLTGNTSGAQTNYQLLLNVSWVTGMQSDFDDLRFCNDTQGIDSWLESKVNSSHALVWVEFPTTPANGINQTYYLYYGNAGVASNWDMGATFPSFSDDFEDGSVSDWTEAMTTFEANASVAKHGSYSLKTSSATWQYGYQSFDAINYPIACDFWIYNPSTVHARQFGLASASTPDRTNSVYSFCDSDGYFKSFDGTTTTDWGLNYNADQWYHVRLVVYPATNTFDAYVDDMDTPLQTGLGTWGTFLGTIQSFYLRNVDSTQYYDTMFIHKYVSAPPSPTFTTTRYYTDSIHYNATAPYNHTIEQDGIITTNRTIVPADDINWTASALSDDCQLVVTEYNLANETIANFTVFNASLDWISVTNLTPSASYDLQFTNSTLIEQCLSDANGVANFTTNIVPEDYQITLHGVLNITLYSVSPEIIQTNHTGGIYVNYIVESTNPLNLSSLAMLFGVNYTTTGDMHSYIAAPHNSIASEGIYRAPNRNTTPYLSWENNTTITEDNVWQWGGGDNSSWWITKNPINATHTWINATGIPEHAFQSSFYLKKGSMYSAPKTAFHVNSQQGLIIKMWDNEQHRGRSVDYIMNMYFDSDWQSTIPTQPIEIWGFNSSFNPDTDDPATSEWGAKIVEWDGNRWVNHSWIPGANASYAHPLTLAASSYQVIPDEINYIYLKSGTQSSKSYVLNATNYDPEICNITYAETETLWTYNELADESTPVAYTPSFFATFVRDDEEFLHHLYIADNQGEWAHSGVNNISIGVSHYPVSPSSFDYFNVTCPTLGYTHDTGMGSTYDNGYIHIGVYFHADPDGGAVDHNITLHYVNETLAGIVNNSFQTTSPGLHEINFSTSPYYSTTNAYILKCVSTDDEGVAVTTWLDSFFTLASDGSQGHYVNTYLMFWGMNDIPTLHATVANNSLISYDAGDDIYTLHVPFFKSKYNDTFRFNETVHLKSLNTEDVAYFRFTGDTIFDNASIHGWNTAADAPAPSTDAYRGYVFSDCQTTGNITNSNLSYLGSDVYRQEGVNFVGNTAGYLIYNTTLSHNSRGLILEECENYNISHCVVSDSAETGIGVYYSDSITVENCSISDSAYDPGVYLYEASNNTIRYNTITDNTDYGMRIRSNSNNNVLIANNITGSGIYDYYFSSASINNTIQDPESATDKIRATSTSGVTIENIDRHVFSEDSSSVAYAYATNFSMLVTGVSQTFNITQHTMTLEANVPVSVWNVSWGNNVSFNTTAGIVGPSPQVWYNITRQDWSNSPIIVYRNGVSYYSDAIDGSGAIEYHYSGGWTTPAGIHLAFVPGDAIEVVTPANGASGTSTNPALEVLVTDPSGHPMNVTFYQSDGAQIGTTQTNIQSGTTASVIWSGRSYNTEYNWYAESDDGAVVVQSSVWSFTTQGSGSGSSHVITITGCTDWSGNAGNQIYIDFGCTGETAGATFTTTAPEGTVNSATGIYTWNTVPADVGTGVARFNVENVYGVSDYCDVTIAIYHYASPTNLAATTGNFWVNHTWDGNGFMDSYNVSVDGVWNNGSTDQHYYHVRSPHAWSNISVAAFNDTTGLSSFISSDVQVPNNAIVLTNYTLVMLAAAGYNVTVDMNHEDLDGDPATYYCSRMDLFTDFNTADGTGQYTNAVNGTHEVIFGVTDGYGWSNQTITIEVGSVHPLELDEETPLLLFVVLVVLLFGSLFYIYHAESYVAKIVTALISTWMSFMLSNMAVSGNVVLNYAELSSGDTFIYGTHSIQIAALSHFFMFTGVVSALFMLAFAVKLVIDTYLDIQEKRKADEEWDGVEQS